MSDTPDLLSTEEVCERLEITPRTLSRKLRAGQFPQPVKRRGKGRGGERFWRADDVERMEEQLDRVPCDALGLAQAHAHHELAIFAEDLGRPLPRVRLLPADSDNAVLIEYDRRREGQAIFVEIGAPRWKAKNADGTWRALPPVEKCRAYVFQGRIRKQGEPPG